MSVNRRLWFPLVAPPLAFGVEGAIGWIVGYRICTSMSIGSVRSVVGIVSLVMLAVAVTALVTAVGSYRDATANARAAADRVEFMALGGVLTSAAFAIGLLWFGLNAIFINGCGGMR